MLFGYSVVNNVRFIPTHDNLEFFLVVTRRPRNHQVGKSPACMKANLKLGSNTNCYSNQHDCKVAKSYSSWSLEYLSWRGPTRTNDSTLPDCQAGSTTTEKASKHAKNQKGKMISSSLWIATKARSFITLPFLFDVSKGVHTGSFHPRMDQKYRW